MIHFQEVASRLKEALFSIEKREKIKDKDLALALELTPQYYAVIKKRGKIPYAEIAYFCRCRNINMNWILLAQKPIYLT